MDITQFAITTLYCLSGLLPIIGFLVSYREHRSRLAHQQARAIHIRAIDRTREDHLAAAQSQVGRDAIELWYASKNSEPDSTGKPYSLRSPVLYVDDSIPRNDQRYQQLQSDMFYVGAAVICGAIASVWSLSA